MSKNVGDIYRLEENRISFERTKTFLKQSMSLAQSCLFVMWTWYLASSPII